MQMKLCEEFVSEHKEAEQQKPQNEGMGQQVGEVNWPKEREDRTRYFEANFKYGSTTVLKHNGEFFFRGDIRHCGSENIFHNARKIKSMMETNGKTMGHMNYNDPPTFSSEWDWEREESARKKICQDDLYKFVGDEIVAADLIGTDPIATSTKTTPLHQKTLLNMLLERMPRTEHN